MNKKEMYSFETQRSNITPKAFFNHCKKVFEKHGESIENWISSYEEWINPIRGCDIRNEHKDWDEPALEICKMKPYEYQMFLAGGYNVIIEFDFWDENKGFGYMYAVEYER